MSDPNGNATGANRGVNVQVAEAGNTPIVPLIGASIDFQLDRTLWSLVNGQLGLHQVTPAIRAVYTVAYDQGRASLQPRLDDLEARCDALYLQAFEPKLRRQVIASRLDDHFTREAERFFAEVAA